MGRPSRANERVAQIVGAYGTVLAEHGVAGVTLARVSASSGLSPSHIRHYVGSFDRVPTLFHERLLEDYVGHYEKLMAEFPPGGKARGLVSGFFGSASGNSSGQQAVIAAVSLASTNPAIADRVLSGFSRLVACFSTALSQDAPGADSQAVSGLAYVLVSLLFGHWTLRGIGFSPQLQAGVVAQGLNMIEAFLSRYDGVSAGNSGFPAGAGA